MRPPQRRGTRNPNATAPPRLDGAEAVAFEETAGGIDYCVAFSAVSRDSMVLGVSLCAILEVATASAMVSML